MTRKEKILHHLSMYVGIIVSASKQAKRLSKEYEAIVEEENKVKLKVVKND